MTTIEYINECLANLTPLNCKPHQGEALNITVDELTLASARTLGRDLGIYPQDGYSISYMKRLSFLFTPSGRCKVKVKDIDTGETEVFVITDAGNALAFRYKLHDVWLAIGGYHYGDVW